MNQVLTNFAIYDKHKFTHERPKLTNAAHGRRPMLTWMRWPRWMQRMVVRITTRTFCEPDRPGIWLWREKASDEWQEVEVGCMGGGGMLFCWWPRMGDIDDPPWRGQWRLEKQCGPTHGRKARR